MSELSDRLAGGEVVCGAGASTFAPAVIEVYGALGLDYVWLDLEHKGPSPGDSHAIERLVRTAEAADLELLVRLPTGAPWLVRKVLDTGVSNLLLARVETAAEVRRAARAATVAYDDEPGARGIGVSRASGWGSGGYEPTNDAPGLGVMVETAAAIDDIDDILAVPELDFAYPGAADLAVSLGHPFEPDDAVVQEALATVTEACRDAGVPLGRSVTAAESVPDLVEEGWQLLRFWDELAAARRSLARLTDRVPDPSQS